MLPELDDRNSAKPPQPMEEITEWDQLTEDEKRFLTAIRERGMPQWMQKRFEKWQTTQANKTSEHGPD